jgi:hypothetical protein
VEQQRHDVAVKIGPQEKPCPGEKVTVTGFHLKHGGWRNGQTANELGYGLFITIPRHRGASIDITDIFRAMVGRVTRKRFEQLERCKPEQLTIVDVKDKTYREYQRDLGDYGTPVFVGTTNGYEVFLDTGELFRWFEQAGFNVTKKGATQTVSALI